jgi:hypothetical protein
MASEIHINDIGTRFLVTVKDGTSVVDISSATSLVIDFRKPDDTIINRTGSTLGDGSASSGVMYYDTVAGDVDAAGNWKLQGKITLSSTGVFYTDIHTFKVHRNL